MAITKYTVRTPSLALSPWRELDPISDRFARLFEDLHWPAGVSGNFAPAMNIEETKDELILTAELPGLTQDDVTIELENNMLTISGEKTEERTEGDDERRCHLWERRYGSFTRSFTLPRTVNGDGIAAHFEDGVLKVTMPKAPEAKGRKIEIGTA